MWQRIRNGLVSGIVLGIALATLAVIGIGFLLAGCYLALAAQIGPAGAALAVGAGALALVGLALALALRRGAAPRLPRRARMNCSPAPASNWPSRWPPIRARRRCSPSASAWCWASAPRRAIS